MKEIQQLFSNKARKSRAKLFLKILSPKQTDKILDLGGGNSSYINKILSNRKLDNVTISDISKDDLNSAENSYGYKTSLLKENENLPFSDNEFDIVFCNSVIEHVTLPKKDVWAFKNTKQFQIISIARQNKFAREIRRIGKSYFVQTPYKYFMIESHTWLPGIIVILPRKLQILLIKFFNRFWLKKTSPDWNLLTFKDMKDLFPEANIFREKSFGMTKSLIAIKKKA